MNMPHVYVTDIFVLVKQSSFTWVFALKSSGMRSPSVPSKRIQLYVYFICIWSFRVTKNGPDSFQDYIRVRMECIIWKSFSLISVATTFCVLISIIYLWRWSWIIRSLSSSSSFYFYINESILKVKWHYKMYATVSDTFFSVRWVLYR